MTKNIIKAALAGLGLTSGNNVVNPGDVTATKPDNLANPATRSLLQENENTTSYDYDELNTTVPEINTTAHNQTNISSDDYDYDFLGSQCTKLFESLDIDRETKDLFINSTKGKLMTFIDGSHKDIDFQNEQWKYVHDYLYSPAGDLSKAVEAMCKIFSGVDPDSRWDNTAKNLTKLTPENAENILTITHDIVEKANNEVNATNATELFKDFVETCFGNGSVYDNLTYSPTQSPSWSHTESPTGPAPQPSSHVPTNSTTQTPTTVIPTQSAASDEAINPLLIALPVAAILIAFGVCYYAKTRSNSARVGVENNDIEMVRLPSTVPTSSSADKVETKIRGSRES